MSLKPYSNLNFVRMNRIRKTLFEHQQKRGGGGEVWSPTVSLSFIPSLFRCFSHYPLSQNMLSLSLSISLSLSFPHYLFALCWKHANLLKNENENERMKKCFTRLNTRNFRRIIFLHFFVIVVKICFLSVVTFMVLAPFRYLRNSKSCLID